MAKPGNRHSSVDLGDGIQLRPEDDGYNSDAAADSLGSLEGLDDFGEYSLETPELQLRKRSTAIGEARPLSCESRKPLRIPVLLILEILVPVLLLLVIRYWPENQQDRRKVDNLLVWATTAQRLAERGEYSLAVVQYNVFLSLADKSGLRSKRLDAAMEDAKAAVARLRTVVANSARQNTAATVVLPPTMRITARSATRPLIQSGPSR